MSLGWGLDMGLNRRLDVCLSWYNVSLSRFLDVRLNRSWVSLLNWVCLNCRMSLDWLDWLNMCLDRLDMRRWNFYRVRSRCSGAWSLRGKSRIDDISVIIGTNIGVVDLSGVGDDIGADESVVDVLGLNDHIRLEVGPDNSRDILWFIALFDWSSESTNISAFKCLEDEKLTQ